MFGRAVGLEHLLGVAVVGGDDAGPARLVHGGDDLGEVAVDLLDGGDRRRDHAGVADHVGVGEVDDPEAVAPLGPVVGELGGRRGGAHLGLLVVGGDVPGRVDQVALLPAPLLLAAAVEEVGDVGVLLGLGDVQLASRRARRSPRPGSSRAPAAGRRPGRASRRWYSVIVVTVQRAGAAPRSNSAKSGSPSAIVSCRARSGRKLTKTTGSSAGDPVVVADHRRLDELVGLVALVGLLHRLHGVVGARRARVHDRVVGALGAVPAAVAVHAPVAPAHRADPAGVAQPALRPPRRSPPPTWAACRGRR